MYELAPCTIDASPRAHPWLFVELRLGHVQELGHRHVSLAWRFHSGRPRLGTLQEQRRVSECSLAALESALPGPVLRGIAPHPPSSRGAFALRSQRQKCGRLMGVRRVAIARDTGATPKRWWIGGGEREKPNIASLLPFHRAVSAPPPPLGVPECPRLGPSALDEVPLGWGVPRLSHKIHFFFYLHDARPPHQYLLLLVRYSAPQLQSQGGPRLCPRPLSAPLQPRPEPQVPRLMSLGSPFALAGDLRA